MGAAKKERWWTQLCDSAHPLAWTGRKFVCKNYHVARAPTKLLAWLKLGRYPGISGASRRQAIRLQEPKDAE